MTDKTEKLKEALEAWDGVTINAERWDAFQDKYGENPCTFVVNAARRWMVIEPLLENPKKTQDDIVESIRNDVSVLSDREADAARLGVIRFARKIEAAIGAGEEKR